MTTLPLPRVLDSSETLRYIGFTAEHAALLFAEWQHRLIACSPIVLNLISFVLSTIDSTSFEAQSAPQPQTETQELESYGLDQVTISAILGSESSFPRGTQTLADCTKNTIEMRFLALEQKGAFVDNEATAEAPTSGHKSAVDIEAGIPPPAAGTVRMYKGLSRKRLLAARQQDPSTLSGQNFELAHLGSAPPCDFSTLPGDIYLSPNRCIASKYAMWARGLHTPAYMLVVDVPHSMLGENCVEVGPKELWRKYIVACRGRQAGREMGWDVAGAVAGNMAAHAVGAVVDEERVEALREESGGEAMQYVFRPKVFKELGRCDMWAVEF